MTSVLGNRENILKMPPTSLKHFTETIHQLLFCKNFVPKITSLVGSETLRGRKVRREQKTRDEPKGGGKLVLERYTVIK